MMLSRSSMMVLCFKVKNTDTVKRQKMEKESSKEYLVFFLWRKGNKLSFEELSSRLSGYVLNKLSTLHKVLLTLQIFPLLNLNCTEPYLGEEYPFFYKKAAAKSPCGGFNTRILHFNVKKTKSSIKQGENRPKDCRTATAQWEFRPSYNRRNEPRSACLYVH